MPRDKTRLLACRRIRNFRSVFNDLEVLTGDGADRDGLPNLFVVRKHDLHAWYNSRNLSKTSKHAQKTPV